LYQGQPVHIPQVSLNQQAASLISDRKEIDSSGKEEWVMAVADDGSGRTAIEIEGRLGCVID
jgi:hypothetical protein